MAEETMVKRLRKVGFLHGFEDEVLENLASVAREIEFPKDKAIFREGDPNSEIYFVESGRVALEICAPGIGCRRIHTVGPGELLGWSPVLEQSQAMATARTLEPTTAIQMNGGQILALCEHNPRFGYLFMRRTALALAKRLSATRLQLVDVYGNQMPETPEPSSKP